MAIKNLASIEKMLNLEAGTLQNAIADEKEVEVELPKLVIRTDEEEQEFKTNLEAEKKERYEAGKEKGVKDEVLANLQKYGINLDETKKNFENFAEALKEKLQKEVGKPKDKKVEELESDKQTLQKTLAEIQEEYNSFKEKTTSQTRQQKINSKLDELLPSENLLIPKDDLKDLFKSKYQFEWQEDDSFVIKDRNGNLLKDEKTTSPLKIDQVASQFSEKYVKKQDKGNGGGDSKVNTGDKSSYDKFVAEMQEKGHNEGSQEFMREFHKRQKDGTVEL